MNNLLNKKSCASVVTRFAPSPTGFLHIGGARTALFNHLLSRHYDGKFLLRIEDTDKVRSTQDAIDKILSGLKWLGLSWDAEVVFQSKNVNRHVEVAHSLLRIGVAFKCYLSGEELLAEKQKAIDEGRAFRSPYRDNIDKDMGPIESDNQNYAVRFRVPDDHLDFIEFDDAVRGHVKISTSQLDDMVLLRADGTPTYMLAVTVDDHDMGITHIIRGDDHLINMARQIPIYLAMGWTVPDSAHVPLIHGQDGKKLSKRHGALGVEDYRQMGYLPEALRNYLIRLGWSHGDAEVFTDQEAVEWFDLDGLQSSPAKLDIEKLNFISSHHLRKANFDSLLEELKYLNRNARPDQKVDMNDEDWTKLRIALPVLVERAAHLQQLFDQSEFLRIKRPIELSGKAAKPFKGEGAERLETIIMQLQQLANWTNDELTKALAVLSDHYGGMGKVGPLIRASVTGGKAAPDLADVMCWIGKEEVLQRLKDQHHIFGSNEQA